jgi:hypothetical protein
MINEAVFNISLTNSINLLTEINLYKGKGPKNIGDYSTEFKKISRRNKHIEIYNAIRDNLDYEIILNDDSFFQFCRLDNYLRFSYIENPNFKYTKYDYLRFSFSEDEILDFSEEDVNELVDENEFEQFLIEQEVNSNLTYIRYDYDKKGYKPLLHSQSHIHIGLNENFRIPSSIILTPLQFVTFTIKQRYFDVWKIYHEKFEVLEFSQKLLDIKNQCKAISDQNIWNDIEKNEIYIS